MRASGDDRASASSLRPAGAASCRRESIMRTRIGRTGLHHLGAIAKALDQSWQGARISHVPQCARRGFAGQRLITVGQHFANLEQHRLRRQVPILVELLQKQRQDRW